MGLDSTKRPAFKRRKLTAVGLSPTVDFVLAPSLSLLTQDALVSSPVPKATVCASCHRAFTARLSLLIQCARCRAPTCAICSRTCTACPPSMPPTPALTFSPTPPPTPPHSPKRAALALSTNTNAAPVATAKRRKLRDADEDEKFGAEGEGKAEKEDVLPGCGRTVCRNCCFESPQSNTTTCHDCYSRPYRAHAQSQDLDYFAMPLFAP
ncbi:hypothetical protein AcW1_003108 [Taiwanofungus camphoratus]|nr:hypothetical protein AcW1_003108 [Antrodia cinnamomea]